ncbi:contractile injection system protein, VgrG/Pvc8 family [Mycolicibacterium neworleansense]|uniref:contractile injection system protein, VgrG/Pvc8 family n=1 Tax=Mycolicibacterium neworleansense TaxID=146018 RepID=UPI0021F2A486|nr:contractile injection system protein, VgrG/Pvc8 family [Mycolicibacterium neworleansense]MCV7363844.1 hypothetical protein [Mycolicibacterium neworleansense]
MTVLSFGATATIGSLRYDAGIAQIRIVQSLGPGVGSARISLPRDLRVDATPGDEVAISLTGESSTPSTVFTGTVLGVRRSLDQNTVQCGDTAAALAGTRSGSTFEQQGVSAIITALAEEAGVPTGTVEADLDLARYTADQGRTTWEHISRLADWAGALATTTADGAVELRPFPSPPADVALRYGREIAELGVTVAAPTSAVVWTGNGPSGNASDARAPLQTTGTLPDSAPGPDAHTIRVAAAALRTPAAAESAAKSYARRNGALRLRAACWLVPQLRAGTLVEIADTPTPQSTGPWLITRVTHVVGPGPAGRTTVEALGTDGAGGGLADQVAGAIGSLS